MAVGIIAGSIGQVGAAAGNLATDALAIINADFLAGLRTASLGGVQFGVFEARTGAGRRNVVHEYPGRDGAWVEDQGQQARRYDIVGFLVESPLLYAGGALSSQRENLLAVVENLPSATLVHPSLGTIPDVNVLAFEFAERMDLGRVIEFQMTLVQGGPRIFPAVTQTTGVDLGAAADGLNAASLVDYAKSIAGPVQMGAAIVQQSVSTAVMFYGQAVLAVHDVKRFWSAVSNLPGNFGRFVGGGNTGFSRSNSQSQEATVSSLIMADTAARAAVYAAGTMLATASATPAQASGVGAESKGLLAALSGAAADPSDAIRMASALAAFVPTQRTTASQIGIGQAAMQSAASALFRRAALAEVARSVSRYQPASINEARALRIQIAAQIGAEVLLAGDAGDTESFRALRILRKAVTTDLDSRSGGLPALKSFQIGQPMPSLALAQRIYADVTREPGLVKQAKPIHPAFVPTQFSALAN